MTEADRHSHDDRIVDELAIRQLIASFADACIRYDVDQFASTWTKDASWIVGKPLASRSDGIDAIIDKLHELRASPDFFTQFVAHGVVEIDGPRATVRSPVWERGMGAGHFYDNLGIYHDTLVKADGIWKFSERRYGYLWLSTDPFPGEAVTGSLD